MARPRSEKPRNIEFKIRMSLEEYEELYKFSKNMHQSKTRTVRQALERYYSEKQDKDQQMLPDVEETENGEDETLEFMLFMDPTGHRKGAIRIMNTLIRNGITSKKIFAEHDPLEFIKFKWIGIISMPYILERHAEARKLFGLDPIPEPNLNELAEKSKEKYEEARIERRERWNNWWEQFHEPRTVKSLLKHAAEAKKIYPISE